MMKSCNHIPQPIGGGTSTGEREDTVLESFLCKKGLTMPLDIS